MTQALSLLKSETPDTLVICLQGWGFSGTFWPEIFAAHQRRPWLLFQEGFLSQEMVPEFLELTKMATSPQGDGHSGAPGRIAIVGWSMGALLALELIKNMLEKSGEDAPFPPLSSVSLFCLSERFRADYIQELRQAVQSVPERALRNFHAKCFWGRKDQYRRFKRLQGPMLRAIGKEAMSREILTRGLSYLAEDHSGLLSDLLDEVAQMTPDAGRPFRLRLFYCSQDVIVPPDSPHISHIKELIGEKVPEADIRTLHAPHFPFFETGPEELI
jgi:pimeloyl-ACP methyl ester carboxylesterase